MLEELQQMVQLKLKISHVFDHTIQNIHIFNSLLVIALKTEDWTEILHDDHIKINEPIN